MLADELLDVPLEARLRPAALVVLPRHLVAAVRDLVQATGAKAIELTSLTTDDGDDRPFTAADERDERREMELPADPDAVGNRLDQRSRPPDVVEHRREEREPVGAVAVEVVLEEVADAREVVLQSHALLVRQASAVRLGLPFAFGEQRVDSRVRVARGRRVARVEIDVEADRTPLLRVELSKLAEAFPAHRFGHHQSFPGRAAILCAWPARSSRSDAEVRDGQLYLCGSLVA